ncbi:MAG: glucose-6-phosphate dehydrogenase [Verrucomicrobia bacterium 21-51-4]|nr:MAG: glucose-6-phosphate dehydrogenase [Verrucomicrobia bacterium 21-51-4]HQU09119.1 glucose-6-phosphate dehydrogenase [Opitutales bacterium]
MYTGDPDKHPFLQGLSKHRGAPPTVIVIFGASGDLTARKLLPAIYNLAVDNLLPADFGLIGFGRKPISDDDFRKDTLADLKRFSRRVPEDSLWQSLGSRIHYHAGSYDDLGAYQQLSKLIDDFQKKLGRDVQVLFYISTPPTVFRPILENLGASGLAARGLDTPLASKVIIEKPFGRNLESAQELNRIITQRFHEHQVFRIDHYLGKETVQDLLVQRFANSIFEPIWNFRHVDCIQITVAEDLGVGTRAGYYDQSGALRDMLQNHTMQLLSLVAMEPPVSLGAEDIRDEKVKLIKAIQPVVLKPEGGDVVRGQYTEGLVSGTKVPGYLQEEGIPHDSCTETFAAVRLNINNWRWQGVPIYLRSGKRLARRVSEIAVQFKRPPGVLFSDTSRFDLAANTMVLQIQPDEGTMLLINSKIPGLETRTQPVKMHFRYSTTFGSATPEAYERLILDAMVGDGTLFIRGDEAEASWKVYTPILDFWQASGRRGLEAYPAGSWGPIASDRLLWENRHEWRRPGP